MLQQKRDTGSRFIWQEERRLRKTSGGKPASSPSGRRREAPIVKNISKSYKRLMLGGSLKPREFTAALFLAAELLRNVSFLHLGVTVSVSHVRAKPPRHHFFFPFLSLDFPISLSFLIPRSLCVLSDMKVTTDFDQLDFFFFNIRSSFLIFSPEPDDITPSCPVVACVKLTAMFLISANHSHQSF